MRYLTVVIIALSLLATGCGDFRETMRVAPYRGGHSAGDPSQLGTKGSNHLVPQQGEMYVTMGAQDTLGSVAKAYGVTLKWLIQRNDIRNPNPKPGTNLIVPARSTGATK
jgi:hypothetical protein